MAATKKEEKKNIKTSTSSGHITNLKQFILETFNIFHVDYLGVMSPKVNQGKNFDKVFLAANFANVVVTLTWLGSDCIIVHLLGAMAFSIKTLGIMIPGIMTISITPLSKTAVSVTIISITILSIITFSIKFTFVTLSINDAQHRRHLA
jgi:hypothetical protein